MGAAKKLEKLPEEKYIEDRLRDGTCVRQDFSMKALGKPDTAYQARVEHLDIGHAKRFADHLEEGGQLWPVVVFVAYIGAKMRAILADGFHRHHAYAHCKRPSIPAYVITVPADQLEHEARLYSSMCNQLAVKTRSDEDKVKAIEMLLSDPLCREWSQNKIALHCGVEKKTARRICANYRSKENISNPDFVIGIDGEKHLVNSGICSGEESRKPRPTTDGRGNTKFRARVNGKRVYLGVNLEEAEEKLKTLFGLTVSPASSETRQCVQEIDSEMPPAARPLQRRIYLTNAEWDALERIAKLNGIESNGMSLRAAAVRFLVRREVERLGELLPS